MGWTTSVLAAPLLWAQAEGLLPEGAALRFRRFPSEAALLEALRSGRLQAGLVDFLEAVRMQSERPIWRVPLVLGMASRHPILIGRAIEWSDLARHRIPVVAGGREHFWAERLLLERGLLPSRAAALLDPLPPDRFGPLAERAPVRFALLDSVPPGWSVLARAERLRTPPMWVLLISDSAAHRYRRELLALLAGWANALVRWEAAPEVASARWAALMNGSAEAMRRAVALYRLGTPRLNEELLSPGGPLWAYQWAAHRFWVRQGRIVRDAPVRPLPDPEGWRALSRGIRR
ncbi:MAG: hypothetical protein N2561_06980 [Bacteroidetes bacterium]|nr:hypothetical protein [Bacteroidota bacterium]